MVDGGTQLRAFLDCFRGSQTISIDSFLGRRTEFQAIGKRAIAALLLSHESTTTLINRETDENWYQYLLNELLADSWEELDFSKLSIITFNYDRSFEHYFITSLVDSYGVRIPEAVAKLCEMEIIHVYGSLGGNLPGQANYIPYGTEIAPDVVDVAARAIRVIPEGRNTDETLMKAQSALLQAERIGFLGFGFDKTNLERLNSAYTCVRNIRRDDAVHMRMVVATCMHLTLAKAQQAAKRLGWREVSTSSYPAGFVASNCRSMLLETLLLE